MERVFNALPLASEMYREESLPASARAYDRDTITLGWEDRLKARGRRRSNGGVEFGTSLPRGIVLRGGDCLVVEAKRLVVEVIERLEAAFVIEPRTPAEWGLFAYHIGNGHLPLMVTGHALVCPDVPGVELLLQYHRIPYSRAEVAFTPSAGLVDHRHT
jgi:urease accessory protein